MRILGLDIATTLGWSIIDDGELVDYGTIISNTSFSLPQRLNFFCKQISALLSKHNPDYVAIEEVILAVSGPSVFSYLARLSGVIINCCFEEVNDKIELYTPSHWKSNSIPNINSRSPKWKIQIEVAMKYGLADDKLMSEMQSVETETTDRLSEYQEKIKTAKTEIDKCTRMLKRKRSPLSVEEKSKVSETIILLTQQRALDKKSFEKEKRQQKKMASQLSDEVYCRTTISTDMADSICIALCLYNTLEVKNES